SARPSYDRRRRSWGGREARARRHGGDGHVGSQAKSFGCNLLAQTYWSAKVSAVAGSRGVLKSGLTLPLRPRSFLRKGLPTLMISSQVATQPSIGHPVQRLSR